MPSLYFPGSGVSVQARAALEAELQSRVCNRDTIPGTRRLVVTTADLKIFRYIAGCFNGGRGDAFPGFRKIARETSCAVGTVSVGTRRLRDAGWLWWRSRLRVVHGALRFVRIYGLPRQPPAVNRSAFGPKPDSSKGRPGDKPLPHRVLRSAARQLEAIPAQAAAQAATVAALSREERLRRHHAAVCEARRRGVPLTL